MPSSLYQLLRRSSLALSFAALLVVPLWHLGTLDVEGAGLAGGGRWAQLAERFGAATVAPGLVGTPWSIEILGIEWMDPLAAVSLLVTGQGSAGVLIAVLPALLAVILLGRFFCGWLCPYVPILALSNGIRSLLGKLGIALPDFKLDRGTPFVLLLCVLLLTALGGAVIAPLVYPPAILGRQLFRAVYFGGVGLGILVVGLAFVFDTFVSRAGFCRFLCPGGAMFRLVGLASPVQVKRDATVCDVCGTCDAVCALDQSPMTDQLDSGCERCGKCVAACPCAALKMTTGRPAAVLIHGGTNVRA